MAGILLPPQGEGRRSVPSSFPVSIKFCSILSSSAAYDLWHWTKECSFIEITIYTYIGAKKLYHVCAALSIKPFQMQDAKRPAPVYAVHIKTRAYTGVGPYKVLC